MPTLLLMRHAKSDWADAHLDDHERPLNERGKRDAPRMGQWLRDREVIPSRIVSSSAVRAKQTAERVVNGLGVARPLNLRDDLYHATVETWLEMLARLPDSDECILCIGHNPGLEGLVLQLTGRPERMSTAAIAVIDVRPPGWASLKTDDVPAKLRVVWRPKELPER
ncbi:MAG: SixA phosphatase family protein [Planctomycetaceae bacterium]